MKVLVFAGFTKSLLHFRKELLSGMVRAGHTVTAIGPEAGYEEQLKELGIAFRQVSFNRLGCNPVKDVWLLLRLIRIFLEEKPDLYFGYTIKPVVYGTIAGFLTGVRKKFVMVTGLGSLFIKGKRQNKSILAVVKLLYRIGFCCSTRVIFQNPDDLKEMLDLGMLKSKKCLLVNGSGVNLEDYTPSPLPQENIFLFIGSIMGDKGIREYMEAASIARTTNSSIQCWIVGPMDQRISGLTENELNHYVSRGCVAYFGPAEDVRPYLDGCRFFVLPSYREGTPRAVLEAMAKGRPVITTDAPGCRETVKDGVNGFLVPVRDSKALAEKMLWLVGHPDEAEKMASESLRIVREKYDVNKVNKYLLRKMGLLK